MRRRLSKHAVLFAIGGSIYTVVELLWRGHTHWTMAAMGGALFLLIGGLNEHLPWEMPLLLQALIGGGIVTAAELTAGLVLNIWLGLGVWDYSGLPGNFLGQICPQFSAAWVGLSLVAVILDDWLRWKLYGEDKPHYRLI